MENLSIIGIWCWNWYENEPESTRWLGRLHSVSYQRVDALLSQIFLQKNITTLKTECRRISKFNVIFTKLCSIFHTHFAVSLVANHFHLDREEVALTFLFPALHSRNEIKGTNHIRFEKVIISFLCTSVQQNEGTHRIHRWTFEHQAAVGCIVVHFDQIFLEKACSVATPQTQFVVFTIVFCQIVFEQIPTKSGQIWN